MSGLRLYDVLLILDPRLAEEEAAQLATRLQQSLVGLGGEVVSAESWGKRRLSFELRKEREGYYVLLQVKATPPVMREHARQLKLNEAVFRFMTTRVVERRRPAPAPTPVEVTAGSGGAPAPDEGGG